MDDGRTPVAQVLNFPENARNIRAENNQMLLKEQETDRFDLLWATNIFCESIMILKWGAERLSNLAKA